MPDDIQTVAQSMALLLEALACMAELARAEAQIRGVLEQSRREGPTGSFVVNGETFRRKRRYLRMMFKAEIVPPAGQFKLVTATSTVSLLSSGRMPSKQRKSIVSGCIGTVNDFCGNMARRLVQARR